MIEINQLIMQVFSIAEFRVKELESIAKSKFKIKLR